MAQSPGIHIEVDPLATLRGHRGAHDRRHGARFPHATSVEIGASGVRGITADISRSGLFVVGTEVPPVRHVVHMTISMASGGRVELIGWVARHAYTPDGRLGAGVSLFGSQPQGALARWERYVIDIAEAPGPATAPELVDLPRARATEYAFVSRRTVAPIAVDTTALVASVDPEPETAEVLFDVDLDES